MAEVADCFSVAKVADCEKRDTFPSGNQALSILSTKKRYCKVWQSHWFHVSSSLAHSYGESHEPSEEAVTASCRIPIPPTELLVFLLVKIVPYITLL